MNGLHVKPKICFFLCHEKYSRTSVKSKLKGLAKKTSTHQDFNSWIALNLMTKFRAVYVYKQVTKGVTKGKGDNLTSL